MRIFTHNRFGGNGTMTVVREPRVCEGKFATVWACEKARVIGTGKGRWHPCWQLSPAARSSDPASEWMRVN